MVGAVAMSLALTAVLVSPSPEPPAVFQNGIGYTASLDLRRALEPEAEPEPPPSISLVPRLPPPPTDLARVQGSPRARGMATAVAVAAQVAMIVAGAVSVQQQNRAVRERRRGEAPPYRPYRWRSLLRPRRSLIAVRVEARWRSHAVGGQDLARTLERLGHVTGGQ